jgi:uncharacterized membrane protein
MALVWLSIVFLMFVALIPFSTAIQSAPPIKPDPVSTFIHSLNMALAVAMLFIIWIYATGKHRLVDSDISPLIVKMYKLICIGCLLFFMLSVGISFINAEIAALVPVPMGVAVIVMQFKMLRMLE